MRYTYLVVTLIKNGLVYDGSGAPPREADVLISGRKITRVGKSASRRHAEKIIDAAGANVIPGLIDVHTDPDLFSALFAGETANPYLAQGVTTVIGGNCGISLAPLLHPSQLVTAFKHRFRISAHWDSLASFLKIVERRGVGVNFGTCVGYSSVADGIARGARRDLSEQERELCKRVLGESLKRGALGISYAIGTSDGRDAPPIEEQAMLSVCRKAKRIVAACLGEKQSCKDRLSAFLERVNEAGVGVCMNHGEPRIGSGNNCFETVLASQGKKRSATLTPSAVELVPFVDFVPEHWRGSSWEKLRELIMLPGMKSEIEESITRRLKEAKRITVARVLDPAFRFFEKKNLSDIAANRGETPERALVSLMRLTKLGAALAVEDMYRGKIEHALAENERLIISPFCEERYGFAEYVKRAREKQTVSFEQILFRAAALPARVYGIPRRGLIQEGYFADIAILKDDLPQTVLVNGKIAWENGKISEGRAGLVVRGSSWLGN